MVALRKALAELRNDAANGRSTILVSRALKSQCKKTGIPAFFHDTFHPHSPFLVTPTSYKCSTMFEEKTKTHM